MSISGKELKEQKRWRHPWVDRTNVDNRVITGRDFQGFLSGFFDGCEERISEYRLGKVEERVHRLEVSSDDNGDDSDSLHSVSNLEPEINEQTR